MLQRRFAPEVDNFPELGGQLARKTHLVVCQNSADRDRMVLRFSTSLL